MCEVALEGRLGSMWSCDLYALAKSLKALLFPKYCQNISKFGVKCYCKVRTRDTPSDLSITYTMLICGKNGLGLLDVNQALTSCHSITYLDEVSSVPVVIYTPSIEPSACSFPPKAGD